MSEIAQERPATNRLVLIAMAAETAAFLIQWLLQQMDVGGALRDLAMILASVVLLGWLAWRLGMIWHSWLSATVIALVGIWLWGYLALPLVRIVIERAAGQLSAELFQAALRGAVHAFTLFSPLALVVAVLFAYTSHRKALGKSGRSR